MKHFSLFLLVITLISCDYFNVKKTTPETFLKEELQTFDWNNVDEYPMFSLCESLSTKGQRKHCFERTLRTHIFEYLQKESIVVSRDVNDTINLKFQVSGTGVLTLTKITIDSLTITQIPNIRNLLAKSLDSLPKIFPAIKRGQHVTTEFNLPIIINVK